MSQLHMSLAGLDTTAAELLALCPGRRIFAFYGEMGAGKTTLIRTLCGKLGVKDNVSSPTFAVINEYRTEKDEAVYHFDLYRIAHIAEAYDMGMEEYLSGSNYCFIEWPEKIEALLPEETVKVNIRTEGEERILSIHLN